jgi:hypothetical protein
MPSAASWSGVWPRPRAGAELPARGRPSFRADRARRTPDRAGRRPSAPGGAALSLSRKIPRPGCPSAAGSFVVWVDAARGATEPRRRTLVLLEDTNPQNGKGRTTTTALAPGAHRLREISESPAGSALPRAAHFLSRLVKDPVLLREEILPLLDGAEGREDWYVARRHEDEEGLYSLQVFVWPPGSRTRIHDHSSWGLTLAPSGPCSRNVTSVATTAPSPATPVWKRCGNWRGDRRTGPLPSGPATGASIGSGIRAAGWRSPSTPTDRGPKKWMAGTTTLPATTFVTGGRRRRDGNERTRMPPDAQASTGG